MSKIRERALAALCAAAFVGLVMIVAWSKYRHLGYNGFDLSIYNQTFWNTIHGHFFENSINPPSYLGDHTEWPILLLAPLYALIPHPLTLIFLQAAMLAACIVPIKRFAKDVSPRPGFRWTFVGIWLANPFVWNLALDEFHIIAFAIPLILLAAYEYRRRRYLPYLLAIIGIALVREDLFIVALGFAVLVVWDRVRGQWNNRDLFAWAVVPAVLTSVIFAFDQVVAGLASPAGYKFLVYYNWLGVGVFGVLLGAVTHPLAVLGHVLTVGTLTTGLVLLLPFLFLPLVGRRWLLVAAAPAAEFLLRRAGVDIVLVRTQYVAPLLPLLFLGAIEGYGTIERAGRIIWRVVPRPVFPVMLAAATVVLWLHYGPGPGIGTAFAADNERIRALRTAISKIPADATVIGTMDTMTALSSRRWLFPLGCVWIGKKQFGVGDYAIPTTPEYAIVDEHDLLYLVTIVPQIDWVRPIYPSFAPNLRQVLVAGNFGIVYQHAGVALLQRGVGGDWPLVNVRNVPKIEHPTHQQLGPLVFLGWSDNGDRTGRRLYFSSRTRVDGNLILTVNGGPSILGNGLYPATEWKPGEVVEIELNADTARMTLQLGEAAGWVVVNGDGSQTLTLPKITPIGDRITISGPP